MGAHWGAVTADEGLGPAAAAAATTAAAARCGRARSMGPEGAASLAPGLAALSSLRTLRLECNPTPDTTIVTTPVTTTVTIP